MKNILKNWFRSFIDRTTPNPTLNDFKEALKSQDMDLVKKCLEFFSPDEAMHMAVDKWMDYPYPCKIPCRPLDCVPEGSEVYQYLRNLGAHTEAEIYEESYKGTSPDTKLCYALREQNIPKILELLKECDINTHYGDDSNWINEDNYNEWHSGHKRPLDFVKWDSNLYKYLKSLGARHQSDFKFLGLETERLIDKVKFMRALKEGDVDEISHYLTKFDVNEKLRRYVLKTTVEDYCDYWVFEDKIYRPLDFVDSTAVKDWLKSLGAKSERDFEEEKRQRRLAEEAAKAEERRKAEMQREQERRAKIAALSA